MPKASEIKRELIWGIIRKIICQEFWQMSVKERKTATGKCFVNWQKSWIYRPQENAVRLVLADFMRIFRACIQPSKTQRNHKQVRIQTQTRSSK